MNALVIIDPHARARAIRAKFFPPIKPVNWIKAKPAPSRNAPDSERHSSLQHNAHVEVYWRNREASVAEMLAGPFTKMMRAVAAKHGLTVHDLRGLSRVRPTVIARQEVMWRGTEELGMSYLEVGRRLGGRDHTTVRHGSGAHAKRNGLTVSARARAL
jgi:hypothetical protein